jgi:DNA-binding PadR family transcriptional regulator
VSTTTYAVLALLADGPRSAYELARLMDRSVRFYWPRAISRVYEEPKKLVALGWATSNEERSRGRSRAVYTITTAGREALAAWLAEPGAGPELEFEGLVKVLAAGHGSIDSLRATLDRVESDARKTLEFGRELAERAVGGDPELAGVAHLRVITWRLLWAHARTVLDWVEWARRYIASWEDTQPAPGRTQAAVEELAAALRLNSRSGSTASSGVAASIVQGIPGGLGLHGLGAVERRRRGAR